MEMIPSSIGPADDQDQARWREQSLRVRLLTGKHVDDVRNEIEDMFAREVAADLEINPDLSRNPFRLIYQQLNVAYMEPPDVRIAGEEMDMGPIITPKLWAQQQGTALYTLALNECLVRVDFKHWADATECSYRLVLPDNCVCHAMPYEPDQPGKVEELRYRKDQWAWDVWDIRDPKNPIFKIEKYDDDSGERVDATAEFAPELAGSYPYRSKNGDPILPYVLYHKRVGSQLWNWSDGTELSRGALRLAALWSHWSDGFLNAAHPQRYALDVDTQAGISRTIGGTGVDVVPVDRKSIIKFQSKGPTGGSLGQFSSAMDPLNAAEALRVFEQGLAVYAGLNPSDLQITQAQSGYAIVVSREGQRRAQKLVEPALRLADQQLLATAAALANMYLGTSLPENPRDYSIHYRALKPSMEERSAQAGTLQAEAEIGIISKIDVLRGLHPEIESDEEALERLLRVQQIEQDLRNFQQIETQETEQPETDDQDVASEPVEMEAPAENVQLTALNGAQVQAAQGIVQAVADGMLPRSSGVEMLASFFNMPEATADDIMGDVGRSFYTPKPKEGK